MGLIALVTSTGNANSTQFHAVPVPVTRAINPHITLSTVLLLNYTNATLPFK